MCPLVQILQIGKVGFDVLLYMFCWVVTANRSIYFKTTKTDDLDFYHCQEIINI